MGRKLPLVSISAICELLCRLGVKEMEIETETEVESSNSRSKDS